MNKVNTISIEDLIGIRPEHPDDKLLFKAQVLQTGKPDPKALGMAPKEAVNKFAWATSATEAMRKVEKWYQLNPQRELLAIISCGPTDLQLSQMCDVDLGDVDGDEGTLLSLKRGGLVTEN